MFKIIRTACMKAIMQYAKAHCNAEALLFEDKPGKASMMLCETFQHSNKKKACRIVTIKITETIKEVEK